MADTSPTPGVRLPVRREVAGAANSNAFGSGPIATLNSQPPLEPPVNASPTDTNDGFAIKRKPVKRRTLEAAEEENVTAADSTPQPPPNPHAAQTQSEEIIVANIGPQLPTYTQAADAGDVQKSKSAAFSITEVQPPPGFKDDNIDPGVFLGPTHEDFPALDWKPIMLRRSGLMILGGTSAVLAIVMFILRWLATDHVEKISKSSGVYGLGLRSLLIWLSLFYFEAWYLVDRAARQMLPFLHMAQGRYKELWLARESLLLNYYPLSPWNHPLGAIRKAHWLLVVTAVAQILCGLIVAFQATVFSFTFIGIWQPIVFYHHGLSEHVFASYINTTLGMGLIKNTLEDMVNREDDGFSYVYQNNWDGYDFAVVGFRVKSADGGYLLNTPGEELGVGKELGNSTLYRGWTAESTVFAGELDCDIAESSVSKTKVDGSEPGYLVKFTDSDGCTSEREFREIAGSGEYTFWGIPTDKKVECRTKQFFSYANVPRDGSPEFMSISCKPSIYVADIGVRTYYSLASVEAPRPGDPYKRFIDGSKFGLVKRRASAELESAVEGAMRASFFEPGYGKLPYWFTFVPPTISTAPYVQGLIDTWDGPSNPRPQNIRELTTQATLAYRRVASKVIAYGTRAADTQQLDQPFTEFNGTATTASYYWTAIADNCLFLGILYAILAVSALFLAYLLNTSGYRYTGLKGDPCTLISKMLLVSSSSGLLAGFKGLEWTRGASDMIERLESFSYRIGYWRIQDQIVHKLDRCQGATAETHRGIKNQNQRSAQLPTRPLTRFESILRHIRGLSAKEEKEKGNAAPEGSMPWRLYRPYYFVVVAMVLGFFLAIILKSQFNGDFPNWIFLDSLSLKRNFLGLSEDSLVWESLTLVLTFLFFKIWLQGTHLTLVIGKPFADMQAPDGASFTSLFRNTHVTPFNPYGFPIDRFLHSRSATRLEMGNKMLLLGLVSYCLYICFGIMGGIFHLVPGVYYNIPRNFELQPLRMPDLTVGIPAVDRSMLSAFRSQLTQSFVPPFATPGGAFAPVRPVGGFELPDAAAEGQFSSYYTISTFVHANFTSCEVLTSKELEFSTDDIAASDGFEGLAKINSTLDVSGCITASGPVKFCPYVGRESTQLQVACGSWDLIVKNQTSDSQGNCSLDGRWLIHKTVVLPKGKSLGPPAPSLVDLLTDDSPADTVNLTSGDYSLIWKAVACKPNFWVNRDVLLFAGIGSDVIRDYTGLPGGDSILYDMLFNSSPLFQPTDTNFSAAYNLKFVEAISKGTLRDVNGSAVDIPSRMTSLFSADDSRLSNLGLQSSAVFAGIFGSYIANEDVFWRHNFFPAPDPATTIQKGSLDVSVRIVELIKGVLFYAFTCFILAFIFVFPYRGRYEKYKLPRQLDSLAGYISYFHSSPLLRYLRDHMKVTAEMTSKDIDKVIEPWHKEGKTGPRRLVFGYVNGVDGSDRTYTIATKER